MSVTPADVREQLHPSLRESFIPITDMDAVIAALLEDRPRIEATFRDLARDVLKHRHLSSDDRCAESEAS